MDCKIRYDGLRDYCGAHESNPSVKKICNACLVDEDCPKIESVQPGKCEFLYPIGHGSCVYEI